MGNFYKRKRRGSGGRTVPLSEGAVAEIEGQIRRFMEKFGREPLPHEPLFFDPDKDVPTPVDGDRMAREMAEGMRKAGIREEIIYAFEKSGILLTEVNRKTARPGDVAAFENAVEEYRRKNGNVTRRWQ